MRAADFHRRSLLSPSSLTPLRAAARRAGAVALCVVGGAAFLLGTLWTVLETGWGGELARRMVLPRVNAAIAGKMRADGLAFGGNWLVVTGAGLDDPEGHPVVRVARIAVWFSPWSALRGKLSIARLEVERPDLRIAAGRDGSNLARALAARRPLSKPAPVEKEPATNGGPALSVAIEQLSVDAGEVDLLPATASGRRVHLRALGVSGWARYDAKSGRSAFDLVATADGGRIYARGGFDLRGRQTTGEGLVIAGEHLDLARLASALPPSDLAFELHARGGGRSLDSLDGALDFTAPPNRLDDHLLGPIAVRVRAVRGRYDLAGLHASLPGLTLDGDGHATPSVLDLHVRLEATDLAATMHSLSPPRGPPLLALSGAGRLDLAVSGPVRSPGLRIAVRAPRLGLGADRIERVSLAAVVDDLRAPASADVEIDVPSGVVAGRPLRGVRVNARIGQGRLAVDARLAAPAPLALTLRGDWRPATREVWLDRLDLAYPEAQWRLAHRARISLGADGASQHLSIEGLAWRSLEQQIDVELFTDPRRWRARLGISRLDLGRLPRALVPPSLQLGGMLEVRGRVDGPADAPRVDAAVTVTRGRVRSYRNLGLDLDFGIANRKAEGHLRAVGLGTSLTTRFDLPMVWPARSARTPLALDVKLDETDLPALGRALAEAGVAPPPLAGRAAVELHLGGTVGAPRLLVDGAARGLAVYGQRAVDVRMTARGGDGQGLTAEISLADPRSSAHARVVLRSGLELGPLLLRPPGPAALARAPLELTGDIERFPLATLSQLVGYRFGVSGELGAHFAFAGPLRAPTGHLTADVTGASSGRFPPTDARIELDLARAAVAFRARVTRQTVALLAAEGRIEAPAGELGQLQRLAAAPIRLRAVLGPFEIERLGLPPETDRDAPRAITGHAHADLAIDGSLRAPRLTGHVQVADIRLDKEPLGYGEMTLGYERRRATIETRMVSSKNQGTLHLMATTSVDLGYPEIARGVDPWRLPLDLQLDARDFELTGLCGITPEVRTVAGVVSAAVAVGGTALDPRLSGRLEWTQGKLVLAGAGEFHDLRLALHGDREHLVLDELAAKSGAGTLHVTGTGTRGQSPGYDVKAQATLKGVPIYQEGQPVASVSALATIAGNASPSATNLVASIHDARVEISDAKRKDLPSLKGPTDVVLVDGANPLNRAQAKRLGAVRQAELRLAPFAAASPGPTAATPKPPAGSVTRIIVAAPRKIWITGKDAYFELGLEPGFELAIGDETRLVGSVEVKRGRVNVFGRRFDLKAGSTVQFQGAPDYPTLDVSAQYQNDSDNVTVLVAAQGPIDHLKITVSSPNRPDLSESQLYALVVTGHLEAGGAGAGSGSAAASAEAASLLGGVIASSIQKTLAKRLPVDVLTIDSGGEGLTGTQLEAGRYVTDKLYVGYVGRIGADPTRYQNHNAVHVEYQLSARWGIDGEYGDVGTGSADLMWKKSY